MRTDVARDLRNSRCDFTESVWPRIAHWCDGGRIIPVETEDSDEMRQALDVFGRIDAWHITKDGALRGIASRVQYRKVYNSFTVRLSRPSGVPTEFQKMCAALEHEGDGRIGPFWTTQAYMDRPRGSLLSVALVETRELIAEAQFQMDREPVIRETATGERFLVLYWKTMHLAYVPLEVWPEEAVL